MTFASRKDPLETTRMRFHFPIIIIDEDFRSENTSGLGIRALAQAIDQAKDGREYGYGLVVLVLAYCGLRWGELSGLRIGAASDKK